MVEVETAQSEAKNPARYTLTTGTLVAAVAAVLTAQMSLSLPGLINGLFQQDLGPTSSQLTWITVAFLLPVAALELGFGVLGDLFGRKRLLVGGSVLVTVGSTLAVLTPGADSSTATRVGVLIAGQVLAGVGAAALFPTSLAMVAAGTHTTATRARGIAIWATALAVGGFFGPLLDGVAAKIGWGSDPFASWRWAYVAVLVDAVIGAVVTVVFAQNSSAPAGRSLDWPGQITVALGLFALLFAVVQGPASGWGSTSVGGGFVAAAVLLGLFIVVESRTDAPLIRLEAFRKRAFSINSLVTLVGMFAFLGVAYSTSIRLTAIQGFTPLKASIAYMFFGGIGLVQLPLTSKLLERYHPRWVLFSGLLLTGAGALWFAAVPPSDRSLGPIIAPLIFVGVGFALSVSAVTAAAVNSMPNHLAGMASGTTNMFRDLGFALGPAVIGAIALGNASSAVKRTVASDPSLNQALNAFRSSAIHAPPAQRGQLELAVNAVNSGPLGANSVPSTITLPSGQNAPFNPLKDVAFHALSHGYSVGYVVAGVAALVAAALTIVADRGNGQGARADQDPHTLDE
jgi:MFS family permease